MNIKFFKDKYKRLNAQSVFLVIMDSDRTGESWPNLLTGYMPIGQHTAVSQDYLKDNVVEITKEEYIKASKGIYTPEEYLKGVNSV